MSTYVVEQCVHPTTFRVTFLPSEADVVLSCTFDLVDEKCPVQIKGHQQIKQGLQADAFRPISDHTRGGEKRWNSPSFAYRFK